MASFISMVAFGFMIYYAIRLFKGHKVRVTSRANKKLKKRYQVGLVISMFIMLIFGSMSSRNETTSKQSSSADTTKVVKKPKYVGKDKYDIAKKENVALLAKQKKLRAKEDKLQEQQDKIASDEAEAKRKEQEQQQQATAQKEQEAQAKAAQKQEQEAAAQQKQQEEEQQQSQQSQQSASQTQTRGDMNTSDTGTIVGNSKTGVYHMPGQAGYRMNSANAVYFHSEQEAIAAGYRRAKR